MGANIRFLIVDDNDLMLRVMRRVVTEIDGLKVAATASNGALAVAAVEPGGIDVVLMDVQMPELDGLSALKRMRESHPHLPVMICSAADEAREECLAAGATEFCLKEEMRPTLARMLDRIGFQRQT